MRINFVWFMFCVCLFVVSCNKIDTASNTSSLFVRDGRAAAESAAAGAWASYRAGDYEAASAGFAALLGSGEEEFIAERSAETGARCGFGYSLLKSGRTDEALYQFEFESDRVLESAIGAAGIYLSRREYAECVKKFAGFDKLFYQRSPYEGAFGLFGDPCREAHKILFLAYCYMPRTAEAAAAMRTQYSFIAGDTAENGISDGAGEIFLKIMEREANQP